MSTSVRTPKTIATVIQRASSGGGSHVKPITLYLLNVPADDNGQPVINPLNAKRGALDWISLPENAGATRRVREKTNQLNGLAERVNAGEISFAKAKRLALG